MQTLPDNSEEDNNVEEVVGNVECPHNEQYDDQPDIAILLRIQLLMITGMKGEWHSNTTTTT